MKKVLFIALIASTFTTSAMAAEGFYVRGDIGAHINNPQKVGNKKEPITLKIGSTAPSIDVGLGYNISNQFRGEFVYTHIFNSEINGTRRFTFEDEIVTHNLKAKSNIDAFMINGIFDAYDFGVGKLFCGAGIGLAQVRDKIITKTTEQVDEDGKVINHNYSTIHKLKKKNNFAYNLMIGSSFKMLSDSAHLDIQYKWDEYGTAKRKGDEPKIRRRGHGIKLGLRFDI